MGDRLAVVNFSHSLEFTTPMMHRSQIREENGRLNLTFLSPKHSMKFATWNVQTLNDPAKGINLAKGMDRYEIDLLGVDECRYTGSDRIMIEGKQVLYGGIEDNRHYQGVTLFCSPSLCSKKLDIMGTSK